MRYAATLCFGVGQIFRERIGQSCANPRELFVIKSVNHCEHLKFFLAQASIDDEPAHLLMWKQLCGPMASKTSSEILLLC